MNIILIGFMGAGKTTVGAVLAKKLNQPLFDTDQLIEKQEGMSVSRIFELYGEGEFRRLETEMLKKNLSGDWVLSVGGGLPLKEENRQLLKRAGTVVYLRVQPETVLKRLKGDRSRPLLQGGDAREKIEFLLKQRSPVYEEGADIVVDVDDKTPEDIGQEILENACCFLDGYAAQEDTFFP